MAQTEGAAQEAAPLFARRLQWPSLDAQAAAAPTRVAPARRAPSHSLWHAGRNQPVTCGDRAGKPAWSQPPAALTPTYTCFGQVPAPSTSAHCPGCPDAKRACPPAAALVNAPHIIPISPLTKHRGAGLPVEDGPASDLRHAGRGAQGGLEVGGAGKPRQQHRAQRVQGGGHHLRRHVRT